MCLGAQRGKWKDGSMNKARKKPISPSLRDVLAANGIESYSMRAKRMREDRLRQLWLSALRPPLGPLERKPA